MSQVLFRCHRGSAMVYTDRTPNGEVLEEGGEVVIEQQPGAETAMDREYPTEDILKVLVGSWKAVGIGQNRAEAGEVSVTPDFTCKIRRYRQVDRFLNPEAEEYSDHILKSGESMQAEVVGSNAVTFLVMGPA